MRLREKYNGSIIDVSYLEDFKTWSQPSRNDLSIYLSIDSGVIAEIKHFLEHYKDLEKGKWVKVEGIEDARVKAAKDEIMKSIKMFEEEIKKKK